MMLVKKGKSSPISLGNGISTKKNKKKKKKKKKN